MRRYKKEKAAHEWSMMMFYATNASVRRTIERVDKTIARIDASNRLYWEKREYELAEEERHASFLGSTYSNDI